MLVRGNCKILHCVITGMKSIDKCETLIVQSLNLHQVMVTNGLEIIQM